MIHVVTGHVCSGKSTHVRNNAKPGDVVIDFDRIALAISIEGATSHDYPPQIIEAARSARLAAMDQAARQHRAGGFDVWIVHAYPEDRDMATYARLGAKVVAMRADDATLLERAARERPAASAAVLERRLAVPQNATPQGGVGSTETPTTNA